MNYHCYICANRGMKRLHERERERALDVTILLSPHWGETGYQTFFYSSVKKLMEEAAHVNSCWRSFQRTLFRPLTKPWVCLRTIFYPPPPFPSFHPTTTLWTVTGKSVRVKLVRPDHFYCGKIGPAGPIVLGEMVRAWDFWSGMIAIRD